MDECSEFNLDKKTFNKKQNENQNKITMRFYKWLSEASGEI